MNQNMLIMVFIIDVTVTIGFVLYDVIRIAQEFKYWYKQKEIFELANWSLRNIELVKNKAWLKETDDCLIKNNTQIALKDFSGNMPLTISRNL